MGVDTHGILSKDIKGKQIFDVIVDKYDKNAIYGIKMTDYKDYENNEQGWIDFKDGDDKRSLFYCITQDREQGTEYDGVNHVCLNLGAWGNSVNIMVDIVKIFGGYVDENDCDDVGYYYIPKDDDFNYSDYIIKRNEIESVLDKNLNDGQRIMIASQILKHKEELKEKL